MLKSIGNRVKKFRLRTLIISAFVVQALVAVLLTEVASIWSMRDTILDLSREIQKESTGRISDELGSLLDEAIVASEEIQSAFNVGQIESLSEKNFSKSAGQLIGQLEAHENLKWISLGSEGGGGLVQIGHNGDREFPYFRIANKNTGNIVENYRFTHGNSRLVNMSTSLSAYDSRASDWYIEVAEKKEFSWTIHYRDDLRDEPHLLASFPIWNGTGEFAGVSSSALDLKSIREILNKDSINGEVEVFVFDRNGRLIFSRNEVGPESVALQDLQNAANEDRGELPMIESTMQAFYEHFESIDTLHEGCRFEYEFDSERHFAYLAPFERNRADWVIAMVMPNHILYDRSAQDVMNIAILCFIAVNIAIVFGALLSNWIIDPLKFMNFNARALANGSWRKLIPEDRKDEIGELSKSFNTMAKRLSDMVTNLESKVKNRTEELHARSLEISKRNKELVDANLKLDRLRDLERREKIVAIADAEKAQLEVLRGQLNPHLLYNCLSSIHVLLSTDHASASDMIIRLANLCRITIKQTRDDLSEVGIESEVLRNYLELEKIRWSDKLDFSIDIEESVESISMPPFVFQPLVENAIKYGQKTSPLPLRIRIVIEQVDQKLSIGVSNTGKWSQSENPESTRIGLVNLKSRLDKLYPGSHEFKIDIMDDWVHVIVLIPISSSVPQPNS